MAALTIANLREAGIITDTTILYIVITDTELDREWMISGHWYDDRILKYVSTKQVFETVRFARSGDEDIMYLTYTI